MVVLLQPRRSDPVVWIPVVLFALYLLAVGVARLLGAGRRAA